MMGKTTFPNIMKTHFNSVWVCLLSLAAFDISNHVEGAIFAINPTDFGPNATLITFAGLKPFAEPTNVSGVGLILQNGQGPDVAFDPGPVREFGPSEGTIIQNIASGFSDLNVYFPGKISDFGFDLRTWPSENINLSFYSSGSLLQTLVIPTRTTTSDPLSPQLFYGFQSSTAFDHLLIAARGPNENFLEMDNLIFAPAPEPGAIALATLGCVSLALRRRLFVGHAGQ